MSHSGLRLHKYMVNAPSSLQLAQIKRRAYYCLRIEQYWHYARWSILLVVLWASAAFLHLPQQLPDWLHFICEATLFGGAFYSLFQKIRYLPPPTEEEIDRRIEHDSKLSFRPLEVLLDHPAFPMGVSPHAAHLQQHLWTIHRQRLLSSLEALRIQPPRLFPRWQEQAIGVLIASIFLALCYVATPHAELRLMAGFVPGYDDDSTPLSPMQAWIDLPPYASGAPIFLNNHPEPLTLPEGAQIHIIIEGAQNRPILTGVSTLQSIHLPSGNWRLDGRLTKSGMITLSERGRLLGQWPTNIIADTPPLVSWTHKAGAQKDDWHTAFPWSVSQPHGVARLEAQLLPVVPPEKASNPAYKINIPLPLEDQPKKAESTTILDLSSNPFAGLMVEGTLCAESISGRRSCSSSQKFHLGSRPFHDPLSRGLLSLRLRIATGQENKTSTIHDLALFASIPLPRDIQAPLVILLRQTQHDLPLAKLSQQLWFLALYAEERAASGPTIAASMLNIRSIQEDAQLQLLTIGEQQPPSVSEQETLHETLETLKAALTFHMNLIFQQASQNGIVMPMPEGKGMPWNQLAGKVQSEALQNHIASAQEHLNEMVNMAEQMRQATMPDLQALSNSMRAQAEARAQRLALKDLIKQETELLNHAQQRLATERPKQAPAPKHKDVSEMSTTELLRQLGIAPPEANTNAAEAESLDQDALLLHANDRQNDHATQYALRVLTTILNRRGEALTQKKMPNLIKAQTDMGVALHSLANRLEGKAIKDIQVVLEDLAQARHEMRQNQASSSNSKKGHLGFIPPPPSASSPNNKHGVSGMTPDNDPNGDADDDEHDEDHAQKNQDPLGRKIDDSADSDAHIPEHEHNRAHDIERELQRRASDRTRPQSELDYLNRLLAPLRHPH